MDNSIYLKLLEILYDQIRLDPGYEVKLMVSLNIGTTTFSILEIKQDKDVHLHFNSLKTCSLLNSPLIVSILGPIVLKEVDQASSSHVASYSSIFLRYHIHA